MAPRDKGIVIVPSSTQRAWYRWHAIGNGKGNYLRASSAVESADRWETQKSRPKWAIQVPDPRASRFDRPCHSLRFFFQAECASLISQVDVWMFFGHLGGPHQGHLLMEPGLLFFKEFEVVKGKQDNERCLIHFCSYHLFVSHCFSMFYSSGFLHKRMRREPFAVGCCDPLWGSDFRRSISGPSETVDEGEREAATAIMQEFWRCDLKSKVPASSGILRLRYPDTYGHSICPVTLWWILFSTWIG